MGHGAGSRGDEQTRETMETRETRIINPDFPVN
jgi:hypothetical protein